MYIHLRVEDEKKWQWWQWRWGHRRRRKFLSREQNERGWQNLIRSITQKWNRTKKLFTLVDIFLKFQSRKKKFHILSEFENFLLDTFHDGERQTIQTVMVIAKQRKRVSNLVKDDHLQWRKGVVWGFSWNAFVSKGLSNFVDIWREIVRGKGFLWGRKGDWKKKRDKLKKIGENPKRQT